MPQYAPSRPCGAQPLLQRIPAVLQPPLFAVQRPWGLPQRPRYALQGPGYVVLRPQYALQGPWSATSPPGLLRPRILHSTIRLKLISLLAVIVHNHVLLLRLVVSDHLQRGRQGGRSRESEN
jgi:hypothetical protein